MIRYCDDPFGVAYLVASLIVSPVGGEEPTRVRSPRALTGRLDLSFSV
jgi:hypothetical protein